MDSILGIDIGFENTIENFGKLIAPEYYPDISNHYLNLDKLKDPFGYECKIKRYNDGQERWICIKGDLKCDAYGNPLSYIGTIQDITERKKTEHEILLHNERFQSLLRIANYKTDNLQDLLDFSLQEAIQLTESRIGYIYFYDEKNKIFKLNSWSKEVHSHCRVAEPNTQYELEKTGCWGDVVRFRKPVMINDFSKSEFEIKGVPQGHVPLKKFLSIPVMVENNIVAVVGVANKEDDYDQTDIIQLTLMMDSVWKVVDRQKMIEE
ncbi:MAG: GAF domain-containing protein, partial [Bacteroidetes bacterium]|nr:GAF domain-containing protein [Bacteroidota bacterium]